MKSLLLLLARLLTTLARVIKPGPASGRRPVSVLTLDTFQQRTGGKGGTDKGGKGKSLKPKA
jgi:hypothetical protein